MIAQFHEVSRFQFTRPQGARQDNLVAEVFITVSIHAPARGAAGVSVEMAGRLVFQFTRPQGARHQSIITLCHSDCFNSRARKGRGVSQAATLRGMPSFNSRARKGRGPRAVPSMELLSVSIHAPARGAAISPL